MSTIPLNERDRAMIDLERDAHALDQPKELEIRARFGVSPSSYYKTLAVLVQLPAAYDYDPLTVLRLRRQRERRRRQRFGASDAGR